MTPGLVPALCALLLALATGALWFRRMRAVALPANRTPFVLAMACAAAVGARAFSLGVDWLGGVAAAVAIALAVLFLVLVAISAQRGSPGAFRLGEPLPDLAAPDDSGECFALSSLAGRPLLLKFFRGHW